ncbi:hypothetical protein DKX38_014539 [Salix brachista]|uniref:Uncharacterized protein n=1 Tax=Salix brachista TaxID=2182728 RepID=A0A5N5LFJ9_9ROSI|nr:hypothetical protein DKX38_014539 [Salix brachista]
MIDHEDNSIMWGTIEPVFIRIRVYHGSLRDSACNLPCLGIYNITSANPPDFAHLVSLYPSFKAFVFYSRDGRPRIDWTHFNSTRVLLLHDHGINWWIPDRHNGDIVRGFDIGTGALELAAFTLPLFLGGLLCDISELIEIRKVTNCQDTLSIEDTNCGVSVNGKGKMVGSGSVVEEAEPLPLSSFVLPSDANKVYSGPPVLLGVVRDGEKLDFCMCNPPFFVAMVEAGLNPKTSFAGTPEDMVCPGGEKAFITHIIEDSVVLKESSRWFTSMLRRKTNIKFLTSKLRDVGVTMITASNDQCKTILRNEAKHPDGAATRSPLEEASNSSSYSQSPSNNLSFSHFVFMTAMLSSWAIFGTIILIDNPKTGGNSET